MFGELEEQMALCDRPKGDVLGISLGVSAKLTERSESCASRSDTSTLASSLLLVVNAV